MTHFVMKARAAYNGVIPDEILALAEEADRSSQNAVAKRLEYSAATISGMLGNTYPGDRETILAKIRGAFMGETVSCPVLGSIGSDQCLREQKAPFSTASPVRTRLYRACRSGCTYSKVKP
jgi:hypothetical protein